jgi:hypothetical protein
VDGLLDDPGPFDDGIRRRVGDGRCRRGEGGGGEQEGN